MRYVCYEMARPKRYETAAAKQKAYRERKRIQVAGIKVHGLEAHNPSYYTKSKIEELREMIKPENLPSAEPVLPVAKPKIYFNDYGAVIPEKVWNDLQEKKRIAAEKGYEFDPQ